MASQKQLFTHDARHPQGAGFTLIEALAAIAILSIAMVILLQSQTQSIHNVQRLQAYERGVFITENQLQWTIIDLNEAASWQDLSLSGRDGDYLWSVKITPERTSTEMGSQIVLLRIQALTKWKEGETETSYALETYYLWGEEQ